MIDNLPSRQILIPIKVIPPPHRQMPYISLLILVTKISDISQLPPELALQILKNLNATDLCLASCVWQTLANDEILWAWVNP